jgi:hypothetical protein
MGQRVKSMEEGTWEQGERRKEKQPATKKHPESRPDPEASGRDREGASWGMEQGASGNEE